MKKLDINEETLTGSDTTPATNGIAVQRQVAWCSPPPNPVLEHASSASHENWCRRSILAPAFGLPDYNAGVRVGPQLIPLTDNNLLVDSEALITGEQRLFAWTVSRLPKHHDIFLGWPESQKQQVSGWSGFSSQLQDTQLWRRRRR